jgi:hypothetical protein
MTNLKSKLVPTLCIAIGLMSAAGVKGSSPGHEREQPIHLKLCELIKNSSRYDGKEVSFHANVFDGMGHGILLLDPGCKQGVRMVTSQPVREHEDLKEFDRAFYSARRKRNQFIAAQFEGRFIYRQAEPRLKWAIDVVKISEIKSVTGSATEATKSGAPSAKE